MFSFPSSRRLLVPAVLLLLLVFTYRLFTSSAPSRSRALLVRNILSQIPQGRQILDQDIASHVIPVPHPSKAHLSPPQRFYYDREFLSSIPPDLTHLEPLLTCMFWQNPHTNHIRLPNPSPTGPKTATSSSPASSPKASTKNPSSAKPTSATPNTPPPAPDSKPCTPSDILALGSLGGLRCATNPTIINIPPTPAERCTGAWTAFPSIPGFHDPRVFWSGKNEPLIIINSGSRYGCVGLWIADLRPLYKPLDHLLKGHDGNKEGPLMSYPHLTELTRNPRADRSPVEKNWMLFFPSRDRAYIHYDMVSHGHSPNTSNTTTNTTSGRSFAKLLGNGYTTPNLADPNEANCFSDTLDSLGRTGHWHQGSNALKLVLCTRGEAMRGDCGEGVDGDKGRSVHFAVMHRKFSNDWELPLRLLARSRWPVLFANETAGGWTGEENWEVEEMGQRQQQEEEHPGRKEGTSRHWQERRWINGSFRDLNAASAPWVKGTRKSLPHGAVQSEQETTSNHSTGNAHNQNWAYFTYTPSIAWAWRPKSAETRREDRDGGAEDRLYLHSLNVGYLDDEVVVGIGIEDKEQAFAKVEARVLLQCLELCPGAV